MPDMKDLNEEMDEDKDSSQGEEQVEKGIEKDDASNDNEMDLDASDDEVMDTDASPEAADEYPEPSDERIRDFDDHNEVDRSTDEATNDYEGLDDHGQTVEEARAMEVGEKPAKTVDGSGPNTLSIVSHSGASNPIPAASRQSKPSAIDEIMEKIHRTIHAIQEKQTDDQAKRQSVEELVGRRQLFEETEAGNTFAAGVADAHEGRATMGSLG